MRNKRKLQRAMIWLMLFSVLFLYPTKAQALTKTTTIDTVDAWQALGAGLLKTGNQEDNSTSFATTVYIEIAYTDAQAQAGVDIIVEVSYNDDDWISLAGGAVTTITDTPATTTLNGAVTATDATITLTDATTGDFDVKARKWFIVDGTVANSESFKTESNSTHVVTMTQDALRSHANSLNCWDMVVEHSFTIPITAGGFRVLINNTDDDADIHFRTWVAKVTAL